jgi:hypothetical protein
MRDRGVAMIEQRAERLFRAARDLPWNAASENDRQAFRHVAQLEEEGARTGVFFMDDHERDHGDPWP